MEVKKMSHDEQVSIMIKKIKQLEIEGMKESGCYVDDFNDWSEFCYDDDFNVEKERMIDKFFVGYFIFGGIDKTGLFPILSNCLIGVEYYVQRETTTVGTFRISYEEHEADMEIEVEKIEMRLFFDKEKLKRETKLLRLLNKKVEEFFEKEVKGFD